MSNRVESTGSRRFAITLEGEPHNCHALAMAPSERETALNQGDWLVLVFAVWSGPDRNQITTAMEVAREVGGTIQVGIRPFDNKEELRAWCPEAKIDWMSPIWLVIREGKLINEMCGPQSREKIVATLKG